MKARTVTLPTSSARMGSSKAVVVTLLVNSVKPAIMAVTAVATTQGGNSVKAAKLSPTATDRPDVWRQKRKQRYTIDSQQSLGFLVVSLYKNNTDAIRVLQKQLI